MPCGNFLFPKRGYINKNIWFEGGLESPVSAAYQLESINLGWDKGPRGTARRFNSFIGQAVVDIDFRWIMSKQNGGPKLIHNRFDFLRQGNLGQSVKLTAISFSKNRVGNSEYAQGILCRFSAVIAFLTKFFGIIGTKRKSC